MLMAGQFDSLRGSLSSISCRAARRWLWCSAHLLAALLALVARGQAAELRAMTPAPPPTALELRDTAGDEHVLAEHRGHVVLLNFWATWCPPCRAELPILEVLARDFRDRGLHVLTVNVGDVGPRLDHWLRELAVGLPVLVDSDGEQGRAWRVTVLPTSFLLDRQGRVRFVLRGPVEGDNSVVRDAVERLLAEP